MQKQCVFVPAPLSPKNWNSLCSRRFSLPFSVSVLCRLVSLTDSPTSPPTHSADTVLTGFEFYPFFSLFHFFFCSPPHDTAYNRSRESLGMVKDESFNVKLQKMSFLSISSGFPPHYLMPPLSKSPPVSLNAFLPPPFFHLRRLSANLPFQQPPPPFSEKSEVVLPPFHQFETVSQPLNLPPPSSLFPYGSRVKSAFCSRPQPAHLSLP